MANCGFLRARSRRAEQRWNVQRSFSPFPFPSPRQPRWPTLNALNRVHVTAGEGGIEEEGGGKSGEEHTTADKRLGLVRALGMRSDSDAYLLLLLAGGLIMGELPRGAGGEGGGRLEGSGARGTLPDADA